MSKLDMDGKAKKIAHRFYLPAMMLALAVGLYANALSHPLLPEDRHALATAPGLLNLADVGEVFLLGDKRPDMLGDGQYHPLLRLSYGANVLVAGGTPTPGSYRLVNLLLLVGIGWLTALWLSRYVGLVAAWIAAFLMVAHPTLQESIILVVGRAQLMAMFGVLGFLWLQRRAIVRGRWHVGGAVIALGMAIIAVGSDTLGLILAPLAIVQAWLPRSAGRQTWWQRRIGTPDPYDHPPAIVHGVAALLLLVPLASSLVGRSVAVGWEAPIGMAHRDLTINPLLGLPFFERLAPAISRAGFYAWQIVMPDLTFNRLPAELHNWSSTSTLAGIAVLVVTVVLLVIWVRLRHWLTLAVVLALGYYLLAGNLLLPAPMYASNRFMLPFLVAAAMVVSWALQIALGASARRRALAIVPCAAIVLVMGMTVAMNHATTRGAATQRMADLQAQVGNPVAMFRFGQAQAEEARYDSALPWFERVVALRPESIEARLALARTLIMLGRPAKADEQFEHLLRLDPHNNFARNQRAVLATIRGDYDAAEQLLSHALAEDPTDVDTLLNRARLAVARGDIPSAIARYQRLLRVHPGHDPGVEELRLLNTSPQD